MAAPEGNKYHLFRERSGANKKLTAEQLFTISEDYFKHMEDSVWNKKEAIKSGEKAGTLIDIPTKTPLSIESFCLFAGIVRQTFINYEKSDDKDLIEVSTYIRERIENNQFEGAVVGAYNPNIIARKLGLADKQDHTTNGKDMPGTSIDASTLSTETLEELLKAGSNGKQ